MVEKLQLQLVIKKNYKMKLKNILIAISNLKKINFKIFLIISLISIMGLLLGSCFFLENEIYYLFGDIH
jgi:hypothetical protein